MYWKFPVGREWGIGPNFCETNLSTAENAKNIFNRESRLVCSTNLPGFFRHSFRKQSKPLIRFYLAQGFSSRKTGKNRNEPHRFGFRWGERTRELSPRLQKNRAKPDEPERPLFSVGRRCRNAPTLPPATQGQPMAWEGQPKSKDGHAKSKLV